MDWLETYATLMRWYGSGSLSQWLDEPLCVIVYLYQFAKKWEQEERQKFELLLVGKKLTDQIT